MTYEPKPTYERQGDWGGIVKYGDDKHLTVMFYMRSVHNPLKSEMQGGKPFYDSIEYVKMHTPGEQTQIIDRPVVPSDKMRFRDLYTHFQEGREQIPSGVPIDLLFPSFPAIADNLRSNGVHTIEQCAALSSHALDNIGMGAQEYKNRAKDYMEAASSGENYHKFNAQMGALKRENERLQRDLQRMSEQFSAIMGQLQRGIPVPAAMIPQAIPGIMKAPYEEAHPQGGVPLPGEPRAPVQQRNDLMAELPQVGSIRRTWAKPKEEHDEEKGHI